MHSLVHSLVPQCTSRHGGASRRSALSFRRATRTRVRASAVENGPVARDDGPVAALERSINTLVVGSSIAVLDAVYADSALLTSYARFFTLETIARVPYFAFVSVLHLYETLGWWKRGDYLKVHFAESWNELHHLLIAEALGGSDRFSDRFLAQHLAVAYYWITVGLYLVSPRMAYNLMEQIEEHAFHTYDDFVSKHGDELAALPVPDVARRYYETGDLWLFDEFQSGGSQVGSRRPRLQSLRDVFEAIRDDEGQHAATMRLCQTAGTLRSPHDAEDRTAEPACGSAIECATAGWRPPP